ncbi:MAG: DUF4197 domain-containing protein [Candidatus Eisenbacteria bacterium]
MNRRLFTGIVAALFLVAGCTGSDLNIGDMLGGSGGPLDEPTVAAGLKEALRVGTERTVSSTSVVDGYLGNALIRIALPEQFETAAGALRTIGLGGKVDELEIAMNRAAEKAAGEAKGVFWDAIVQMTLTDAFGILNGGDAAATEYFRGRTSEELRARFRPIVETKMNEVGLYRAYESALSAYTAIPFTSKPEVDLEEHVTNKALDGLFHVLADEEKRIRQDPAARTTDLLRKVFGK